MADNVAQRQRQQRRQELFLRSLELLCQWLAPVDLCRMGCVCRDALAVVTPDHVWRGSADAAWGAQYRRDNQQLQQIGQGPSFAVVAKAVLRMQSYRGLCRVLHAMGGVSIVGWYRVAPSAVGGADFQGRLLRIRPTPDGTLVAERCDGFGVHETVFTLRVHHVRDTGNWAEDVSVAAQLQQQGPGRVRDEHRTCRLVVDTAAGDPITFERQGRDFRVTTSHGAVTVLHPISLAPKPMPSRAERAAAERRRQRSRVNALNEWAAGPVARSVDAIAEAEAVPCEQKQEDNDIDDSSTAQGADRPTSAPLISDSVPDPDPAVERDPNVHPDRESLPHTRDEGQQEEGRQGVEEAPDTWHAAAASSPAAQDQFVDEVVQSIQGLWVGLYGTDRTELIHTYLVDETATTGGIFLEGMKVIGDANVPGSKLSFRVNLRDLRDHFLVGSVRASDPNWVTHTHTPQGGVMIELIYSLHYTRFCKACFPGMGQINASQSSWNPSWIPVDLVVWNVDAMDAVSRTLPDTVIARNFNLNAAFSVIFASEHNSMAHAISFKRYAIAPPVWETAVLTREEFDALSEEPDVAGDGDHAHGGYRASARADGGGGDDSDGDGDGHGGTPVPGEYLLHRGSRGRPS